MAKKISLVVSLIPDATLRRAWAVDRLKELQGKECFLTFRGNKQGHVMEFEPSLDFLSKMAGQKLRSREDMQKTLCDQLIEDLKTHVASKRDYGTSASMAGRLKGMGRFVKDPAQRTQWVEALSKVMAGKESFIISDRNGTRPFVDLTAGVIAELKKSLNPSTD